MAEAEGALLKVENVVTGYGKHPVLNGVSLSVSQGEVVALVGHNGAGKSTLLKAVFGLLPVWSGSIAIAGSPVEPTPKVLLRAGVAYVPQGNRVFTDLSVRENLEISGRALCGTDFSLRVQQTLTCFPHLRTRLGQLAGTLSGGERQMLALACALILAPRLFLLDEPSLGLAAGATNQTLLEIRAIADRSSAGVLIVEQKVRQVLSVAQRAFVLRNGRITYGGPARELSENEEKLRAVYL